MSALEANMARTATEAPAMGALAKSGAIEQLSQLFGEKPLLLAALLLLATLLLYSPVAHHSFLRFDDGAYVTDNPHVNTGLTASNTLWAFTAFHEANWHPVTWISHMADCQLFGLNSGSHHLVNVLLHAANVLLLFFLLQRATGAVWRSFLVCALFAVHPLNVETVAWVAQRKTLLCTLFSLLTVAAYGWYVRRPGWARYLLVVSAFALALMSKAMAVSLPFVLLLFDYWPLRRYEDLATRRRWIRLTLEKLPLLAMSLASSVVTMVAQRSGGTVAEISALPFYVRLENAIVSYVAYIGKMLWPASLAVFYPHAQHALPPLEVLGFAAILIAITLAVLCLHRLRYLVTGWLFFLITLVPVIGFVQVGRQAMADRYAYIPCIGLFIVIAWGLGQLADANPSMRLIPAVAALLLVVSYGAAAANYLQYWQNGVTLFTRASAMNKTPDPVIEEALADALLSSGRLDDAFQHYRETCVLRPDYPVCHYNMAEILFTRHQLQDALEQYQLALSLTHSQDMAISSLTNSGEILFELGDYQTAQMRVAAALQIDPNNSAALRLQRRISK
jgi:protein O-mannosyl-transferase